MIGSSFQCIAQEDLNSKKIVVKNIWEIPHITFWQKLMWVHRTAAFFITKERPVNYDTSYIKSYYKRLVITLPVYTRVLKFSIHDIKRGNKLSFSPNLKYNVGVSISSRWASFIVNTGIKLYDNDMGIKGKTKYLDLQLNLYGRKITTDMYMQSYRGFYINNSKSFVNYVNDVPFAIRNDVTALNIGVSTYFIMNNKKFSYGNSFSFVEKQKKSAGSLLLGIYYSYFQAKGNPSLITLPFRSNFDSLSYIQSAQIQNLGLNLGYIYTKVFFKKCFVTASLVQGFGGKSLAYLNDDNSKYRKVIGDAGKLQVRLATGFDNGRFLMGVMYSSDYYFFKERSNSSFEFSFGKYMMYVGYRFSVLKTEKKLLRKLKLIDYSY